MDYTFQSSIPQYRSCMHMFLNETSNEAQYLLKFLLKGFQNFSTSPSDVPIPSTNISVRGYGPGQYNGESWQLPEN